VRKGGSSVVGSRGWHGDKWMIDLKLWELYSRKQPCLAFWVSGTTEENARFDLESCILAALERLHWRNLTWLHAIHNLTAGFPWKHAELTLPTHSAVSFRHC
jgi:hypothetical protein